MGRPALYKTEEEKKAAACARSRRYYDSHRDNICRSRKAKYELKKSNTTLEAVNPATVKKKPIKGEEELRFDNRRKSRQSYQRNKSQAKVEVRKKILLGDTESAQSNTAHRREQNKAVWEEHTAYLRSYYELDILRNVPLRAFLGGAANRYMQSSALDEFEQTLSQLNRLNDGVQAHEEDIAKEVGAGAHLDSLKSLSESILITTRMVRDMAAVATDCGADVFIDWYSDGFLLYQRSELP
ncbi:hypothetical protein DFP72DRAFT_1081837 [Ephemerocybe angulata]|uniref:Uncharacterized protein n=1 Tax=Ephemerocybe angulata TaxID=980116 RepID=A0A8H6LSV5_9AGAR|nr:hypothetical protein DFP72DRAFT_1081837 [Tulosesus angulatus]